MTNDLAPAQPMLGKPATVPTRPTHNSSSMSADDVRAIGSVGPAHALPRQLQPKQALPSPLRSPMDNQSAGSPSNRPIPAVHFAQSNNQSANSSSSRSNPSTHGAQSIGANCSARHSPTDNRSASPSSSRPTPSIHRAQTIDGTLPPPHQPIPGFNLIAPTLSSAGPTIDRLPSIFSGGDEHNKSMSMQQITHSTSSPESRAANDAWYLGQAPKLKLCPESYKWVAVAPCEGDDGGYMCERGGHGQTREMITEGKGALCVMENKGKWEEKTGPYYPAGPVEFKDGVEKRVYVYMERETPFQGVDVPARLRKGEKEKK